MLRCAGLLLPERSEEAILGMGIMPVVSFRNLDNSNPRPTIFLGYVLCQTNCVVIRHIGDLK